MNPHQFEICLPPAHAGPPEKRNGPSEKGAAPVRNQTVATKSASVKDRPLLLEAALYLGQHGEPDEAINAWEAAVR